MNYINYILDNIVCCFAFIGLGTAIYWIYKLAIFIKSKIPFPKAIEEKLKKLTKFLNFKFLSFFYFVIAFLLLFITLTKDHFHIPDNDIAETFTYIGTVFGALALGLALYSFEITESSPNTSIELKKINDKLDIIEGKLTNMKSIPNNRKK